jgi:hypothetical protein
MDLALVQDKFIKFKLVDDFDEDFWCTSWESSGYVSLSRNTNPADAAKDISKRIGDRFHLCFRSSQKRNNEEEIVVYYNLVSIVE